MHTRAWRAWAVLALLASAACNSFDEPQPALPPLDDLNATGGSAGGPTPTTPPIVPIGAPIVVPAQPELNDLGAECDPNRKLGAVGSALIVRDPEVLAEFSLERTLRQIASTAHVQLSPEQFLQRLFDTENTSADGVFPDVLHCDFAENPAFKNAKAVDCPRAEGRLARSTSMFTAGAADFFAPVALVNRFDLTPSDRSTCGEYRIVYAKYSGRTDAQDRVFLIFEGALPNSMNSLATCRPVAELWASLSQVDMQTRKTRLSTLFFEGLGSLQPVLSAAHLMESGGNCQYSGLCGQIRVGQGMQAPFQFRQFRLLATGGVEQPSELSILPTPDSQSVLAQRFELSAPQSSFRNELLEAVQDLSTPELARVRARMHPSNDAGESAVAGAARPNFAERLAASPAAESTSLADEISQRLVEPNQLCASDPLTPAAIVQRATATTCAGCHAPEQVLSEGRKVGCAGVWPKSQGVTHINELGELSPALTEVFLPYRAEVLSTYLQACDARQVEANLQPVPSPVFPECFPAGTRITLANGARKPIEQVEASEWVLSFDRMTHALVPARVTQRIVRQDARRFVRINESLVATDNHPFFTEAGWVRAEDLRVGSTLLSLDEARGTTRSEPGLKPTSIARLTLEGGSGPTYNLLVEGQHSYFAAGVLVHDRP
ncbi:MAG: Hint domain-containing protein [Pseudomonadota bacterium]